MNTTRIMLVLLVGAAVAGFAGWYLSNRYIEDSLENYKQQVDAGQEKIKVVVAATDLPVGVSINASNAVLREMPKAYVHHDAITEKTFDTINGRQLLYPLASGDPVLVAHVSLSQYRSFSDVIPKGMQALTIPIDSQNSISGFLAPGNFIDLLLTTRLGSGSQTTQLLTAVKVIATGRNIDNGLAPTQKYDEITLSVSHLDATRVTHALSIGRITVVLRTQDDMSTSEKITINESNLLGIKEQPKIVPVKTREFEVIKGGQ